MGKSVYSSVDELPDLTQEPVHHVDPITKKITTYKSVDDLPDLSTEKKNSVPSEAYSSDNFINKGADIQPKKEETPIDIAKKIKDLEGKTTTDVTPSIGGLSGGGNTVISKDANAQKEADDLKKGLKDSGIDYEQYNRLFNDMPEGMYNIPGLTKPELIQGLKDHPEKTERIISAAKSQNILLNKYKELQQANPNINLGIDENTILKSGNDVNYDDNGVGTKRGDNKALINFANNNILDDKERKSVLQNLSVDKAYSYGQQAADNPVGLSKDPLAKVINPTQLAAYQYMQDLHPEQAKGYEAAFVDPKEITTTEGKIGREEKLKKLDEIGLDLKTNYAKEQLSSIGESYQKLATESQTRQLSPEEISTAENLKTQGEKYSRIIESAKEERQGLLLKYPNAGYLDAENMAQELLGQKHGFLSHLALESGKATGNTVKGVYDFAKEPFLSEKQSQINQLEILGDSKLDENSTHVNQENKLLQTFTPTVGKELQTDIDVIKNNKDLSEDEKRAKVTDLLMTRSGEWKPTPIEGGKSNVGLTSLMYGVGDMAANLAPFIVGEAGLTKVGASKFTSLFTSAASTSFHETYANAIEQGVENPYAHAMRVTAVNAFAMAGADTPDAIRKLAGNQKTAISDLVLKMTDKEILTALRSEPSAFSTLKKVYNIGNKIVGSTVESSKAAAKITTATTLGTIANDAGDGNLKSPVDYAKQAGISALTFAIGGGLMGLAGKVNEKVTDINKAAIYTAGSRPEPFIEALDQKIKSGSISPEDATQVRKNIDMATEVFKNNPFVDFNGNPLSEKNKRDFMFLRLKEVDLENYINKDLPKDLQVKMQQRLSDVQDNIDKLYKGTYIEPTKTVQGSTKGEQAEPVSSTDTPKEQQPSNVGNNNEGFQEAGKKSKDAQDPSHLGDWIVDNSQVGDKIKVNEDEYYEVAARRVNKKGHTEVELQHYYKNDNGEFENNPSAVKIFTDKYRNEESSTMRKLGTNAASDLFETSYRDNNGEKVTETATYEPKEQPSEINKNGNITEEDGKSLPKIEQQPEGQGIKKPVPENPDAVGQGDAKLTTPVLKEEATELTPEEKVFAKDNIHDDSVNTIIKDNGITPENIEENKHFFTDNGFPFSKEDYELIKKSFDEKGRRIDEPAEDEQQGTGDAGDKKAGIEGEEEPGIKKLGEDAGNTGRKPPEEQEQGDSVNSTSIKNKVVDAEREVIGESQFTKPDMRGYEKIVLPEAKKAVDSGAVNHNTLAAELAANPRPISDTEVGILTYGRKILQNEEKHLLDAIESAQTIGDKGKEMELRVQLDANEANLINNDIASEKSGTATARGFAARRMIIKEDYSLDRIQQQVRINNDGKVSDETTKKIEGLIKELEDKQNELDDYHENQSKKAGEEAIKLAQDKIKKEVAKKIPVLKDGKLPKSASDADKQRVSDFFNKLKIKTDGQVYSSVVPFLTPKAWNGFVEVIKKSVLAGMEIADAIKKGVEYLHGEKVEDKDIKAALLHFKIEAGIEKESVKNKALEGIKTKLDDESNKDKSNKDILTSITPELTKLAKEYLKEGASTMDEVVDKIHEQIKDRFDDLTKREVRDAVSGYGTTLELSKDEIDKQLRELKAQARVVSGLEDVEQGQAPLRSGLQRDEQSVEVRALKKQLESNMRKAGIEATPRDVTKQLKTALDTVKKRLENQIEDLNKAIDSGEKMPKKEGIEYDKAAKDLQKERDRVKEIYDKLFKEDKSITDEQRIVMAKRAIEKSIKEYNRRIDEKDFEPKKKNDPVTSAELEKLKTERDEARKMYNDLMPEEIMYKAKLDRYSKYLDKRLKALQDKIDAGDFSDKPKKQPLILPNDLITKRANVERTKRKLDKLVDDYKYQNRTKFEKSLDFIGRFRRGVLLSSVATIGKLTSAAFQRPLNNLAEKGVGSLLHYPLHSISKRAPYEGGVFNYKQDIAPIAEMWSKNTLKDTWNIAKKGSAELSLLMDKRHDSYRGVLDLAGQIHAALKNPVKRYAFKQSVIKRTAFALKNGENIHSPVVQSRIAIEAYADGQRAIFMQDNMLSDMYSNAMGRWSKGTDKEKAVAAIAKFFLPIVKVPTNFVAETSAYYIGGIKAAVAIAKGIKNLKPEQADYIMRNFKKQGVGISVFMLGYFSAANLGGFYNGKRDEEDLKAGDVRLFGVKIPHWMMHTPLWTVAQAGATYARIKHSYEEEDKDSAFVDAMKVTFKSTIDGVPFVQTPARMYEAFKSTGSVENTAGATAKSLLIPPDLQKLAEKFDEDENGETRKVDQKGFMKQLQEGIPGLRNKLETKDVH